MLCHCRHLKYRTIDKLKLSLSKCFSSDRNGIKSSIIYVVTQKQPLLSERNYGISVNKCLLNNNLTNFQKDQRRNFTYESVLQIHIGFVKYLSESTVVGYTQNFMIFIHDSSGLPWWASIILTTWLFRSLVTVPLALYQSYILAKLQNLSSEMPAIIEELKRETALAIRMFHWSEQQAKFAFRRSAKKQWTKLIERDNCHPFKASLLIWFQIPLWVVISVALRNIVFMMPHPDASAQIRFLELTVGGCLWFPNLTIPDSIYLPVILGLTNLCIVEIQSLMRINEESRLQKYMTNFFRVFSIIMVPIAATVPSSLTLYWVSSSMFGLCQNLVLMSPTVKQLVGIPKTKNDIPKPYTHLMKQIKNRFQL